MEPWDGILEPMPRYRETVSLTVSVSGLHRAVSAAWGIAGTTSGRLCVRFAPEPGGEVPQGLSMVIESGGGIGQQ